MYFCYYSWLHRHAQSMYSISNPGNPAASAGFRNYPPSLSIPPTSIPSDFYRFSPGGLLQGSGLPPHPSLAHHLVGSPSKHSDSHHDHNHRSSNLSDQKSSSSETHGSKNASESGQSNNSQNDKKKPHIKKPLNAFMLYMKEMRAKVVAECTLKESAAINQILGRRWHALGRDEQAKYYELARRERQLHMQMYPNWSSAQSRTHHEKKRKKKQEKFDGGNSMKKCRARYGLDQQQNWCKPCRRKKKCIRYLEGDSGEGGLGPDDNLGSAGSAGEACTPDSKTGMDSDMDCKSSDMGMSSPNFSLTSPGMSLLSPGMSMTSPGMSLPSPALTSPCPSGILPSPASLASPAVSLPSLQSPMTPMLDDRHPISSVGSTSSSVNFTTTSSSSVTTSSSSSTSPVLPIPIPHSLLGLSALSSSSSSSSSSKNHHHLNNHHPSNHQSHHHHNLHLGHLFNSSLNNSNNNSSSNSNNNNNNGLPLSLPKGPLPHRNPVGANPHDINNPLNIHNLKSESTGQCNSSSSSSSSLNSNSTKNRASKTTSSENGNSAPIPMLGVT